MLSRASGAFVPYPGPSRLFEDAMNGRVRARRLRRRLGVVGSRRLGDGPEPLRRPRMPAALTPRPPAPLPRERRRRSGPATTAPRPTVPGGGPLGVEAGVECEAGHAVVAVGGASPRLIEVAERAVGGPPPHARPRRRHLPGVVGRPPGSATQAAATPWAGWNATSRRPPNTWPGRPRNAHNRSATRSIGLPSRSAKERLRWQDGPRYGSKRDGSTVPSAGSRQRR